MTTNVNKSGSKVLYYSVEINDYNNIIKIVHSELLKSNDILSGVYKKVNESFDKFEEAITDDTKKTIEEKFADHINKLKSGEHFIINNDKLYIVNSEFHITTLFTGGKVHEKSSELEEQNGKKVLVKVNKLGISDNFIALGVEHIRLDDDSEVAYYGNIVKHITVGLNKMNKKVLPKDSYTAFNDGTISNLDIVVNGKCNKK